MGLDKTFTIIRNAIYDGVTGLFEKIAQYYGYPENLGLPILPDALQNDSDFVELPKRITFFPPAQYPQTWFEMIFGPTPQINALPRYNLATKEGGFYDFYIEDYRNLFFLPDSISETIQVYFNSAVDISGLETVREIIFIGLVFYSQMVILRITLSWLLYINPYSFPWSYITTAVDWTEDSLQGVIPSVLGVNVTGSVFLGALGVIADSLNHLVFTMPYLPSQGEKDQIPINNVMTDILIFRGLPDPWINFPIPNDLRSLWFYQRTDIFDYMHSNYPYLDLIPNPGT